MKCSEALEYLKEHFGDDIGVEVYSELQKHIDECDDCHISYDSVRKTVLLYQSCEEPKEVPETIHDKLLKMLNIDEHG